MAARRLVEHASHAQMEEARQIVIRDAKIRSLPVCVRMQTKYGTCAKLIVGGEINARRHVITAPMVCHHVEPTHNRHKHRRHQRRRQRRHQHQHQRRRRRRQQHQQRHQLRQRHQHHLHQIHQVHQVIGRSALQHTMAMKVLVVIAVELSCGHKAMQVVKVGSMGYTSQQHRTCGDLHWHRYQYRRLCTMHWKSCNSRSHRRMSRWWWSSLHWCQESFRPQHKSI
mmetsp:Transcript_88166/g.138094  ORF Transcript_88166/g.138094 Transcript_88166/m.138094 type:complete len:225 (+) Transcript_88166:347-1021(+)